MSKTINQINEEKDPEHESDAIAFKLGVEHGRKGLEPEHKHQHYLEGHTLGKRQREDFPKLYESFDSGEPVRIKRPGHWENVVGFAKPAKDDPEFYDVSDYQEYPMYGKYHSSELEKAPHPETGEIHVREDANVVGGGAIAGVGVGPQGEPGVTKSKYNAVNVLMDLMKRNRVNVTTN